jgi:metal-responsive CopG/Arc/MetJ family transcriptional regulator
MKAVMKKEKEIKSNSDKARVQFDFSKESLEKLDEIKDTVNASTRAEVIRRALTLFTEVLEAENRGARVMFQEKDGTQARLMLLF